MYQLAQVDVIECLGSILQMIFYETKQDEIIVTPTKIADRLKTEMEKTRQKKLFKNRRWERGLRINCINNMRGALDFCNFWSEPIGNDKYKVKKINGLKSKKNFQNKFLLFIRSLSPYYLAYRIDKKRYTKIIPLVFGK
ncbi:MAG: hypothetical protein PHH82_02205 [Candidatus ainarchaeum sp.]|nr:hypothetical protein [Candidatus ainarchaeum sp.]